MSYNPIDDEEQLSYIILGGMRSPGVCVLTNYKREENIDVQEAKGQTGASTVRQGAKVGAPVATFYLIKDDSLEIDDFALWPEFQALIESTVSGATPQALDIEHPDLQRNGYKSVIKKYVGEMEYDGKGGAKIAVGFSEYFPKKAVASGSPKGSKKDAFDAQIDAATATLNGLLGNASKTK